jgi:hypothetical protein
MLFLLTLVYYNVGLGLRERVMAYPMIFSTLVALWSLREKRKLTLVPRHAVPGLMVKPQANTPATEH